MHKCAIAYDHPYASKLIGGILSQKIMTRNAYINYYVKTHITILQNCICFGFLLNHVRGAAITTGL